MRKRDCIYNQSQVIFPEDDGINVATGSHSSIKVSREFTNFLPYPYNKCMKSLNDELIENNEMFDQMREHFKSEY